MGIWLRESVRAPDFPGTPWLNSSQMYSLASLRGRVALVFIWDYSCINSLNTLPVVQAWHDRYGAAGLAVIGVHTPRFALQVMRETAGQRDQGAHREAGPLRRHRWNRCRNCTPASQRLSADAQG